MSNGDELGKGDALAAAALPQLDDLVGRHGLLIEDIGAHRLSCAEAAGFVTAALAAIDRIAGPDSQFAVRAKKAADAYAFWQPGEMVQIVGAHLVEVRHAVVSGWLVSIQELVHAQVFGDFLEMAGYLLEEGYKDPAAVLTGGVLEGHLRKLCVKHEIPIEVPGKRGVPRPKPAETMNADLGRKPVYSKLDHKSVTAWLDLRNDAAHGHYHKYTDSQVDLMLRGVTDFLTRHPA